MDGLFHGKSIYKWMMTEGNPISGNLEMWIHLSLGSCRVLSSGTPLGQLQGHKTLP